MAEEPTPQQGRAEDRREPGRRAIRVLLADDHAVLREGIASFLARTDDIEVVGQAVDGRDAIAKCAALAPDVVLMDIAMPGLGGLEATLEIGRQCPHSKVLVLTQYPDREYVRRFLKAGAAGYMLKKRAAAELAAAIRAVQQGGLVLDPEVARDAVERPEAPAAPPAPGAAGDDPYEALTDREKQVLKLLAEGMSNKEVAAVLGVSVKTAMSHREHVMKKLSVHTRTELVMFAVKKGVIRVE